MKEKETAVSKFQECEDFLATLSEEQAEAALNFDHPVMNIACPGSGKTRSTIARMIKLLMPEEVGGRGVAPDSVMMLTFTNKAAKEMRDRAKIVFEPLRESGINGSPWIGTFHALSLRILRIEAEQTNLGSNFTILDDSDSEAIIMECVEQMGLSKEGFDMDLFKKDLDNAKGQVLTPQAIRTQMEKIRNHPADRPMNRFLQEWNERLSVFQSEHFIEIYEVYQKELERQNSADFSDLLNIVTSLLRENPAVRDSWRATFRHFLVDEAQDLNYAQLAFLTEITGGCMPHEYEADAKWSNYSTAMAGDHAVNRDRATEKQTLYVVADDDQAIYGFRGAPGRKMLHSIIREFPEMPEEPCYLQENYRSPPDVLKFAENLIRKNKGRFDKSIKPADPSRQNNVVKIYAYDTWEDEIEALGNEISGYIRKGGSPSDFGVLSRTRNGARAIARKLRDAGIPVTEGKSSDLQKSAEIKNLMAYCNSLVNDYSEGSLRRIINVPSRGMGKTSITKLTENAQKGGRDFRGELRRVMNLDENDKEAREEYTKSFIVAAKNFGRTFIKMRQEVRDAEDASEALLSILKLSGYYKHLCEQALLSIDGIDPEAEDIQPLYDLNPREFITEVMKLGDKKNTDFEDQDMSELTDSAGRKSEALRRIGNIGIVVEMAQPSSTLSDFVQEMTLEATTQEEAPGVRVMTIHASKGLEMPHVRLPFWGAGIFPNANMEPKDEAEERNMAFVAASRAERSLSISYPKSIGKTPFYHGPNLRFVKPSQFIEEGLFKHCDYAAIYNGSDGRRMGQARGGSFNDFREPPVPDVKVQQTVEYPDYGDYDHDFQ